MHHVLVGGSATVCFLFPPSIAVAWIHDAAIKLLTDITPNTQAYHLLFDAKKGRNAKGRSEGVEANLIESYLLLAFATDASHFPEKLLSVADRVISLEDVDFLDIEMAFRAIMGVNAPSETIKAASKFPDGMLSAIIKRGRRLQDVIDILRRAAPSKIESTHAPSFDTLSGYGEAAKWGHALATDLVEYAAGRITWADVDRGALLSGPTGTGKTYFVQSLAATCGIPLFAHSLARWQAKGHLGNLLSAMRAAFDQATENAPSILLIDEFDAIGSRDRFSGDNEQYCIEVVNGLLECLDGVQKRTGVVVIGATNFPERIDPALLRPGRLGRHLRIEIPDADARLGILRHHLGTAIPKADLSEVGARLEGSTGAVIEQIVRDARRRARSENRQIDLPDLTSSLPERQQLSEEAFARACIHEAGHAIVGYLLRFEAGATPSEVKVFRELRNATSGAGHTVFDRKHYFDRSRKTYDAAITTLLAGLAAETLILGEHGDFGGGKQGSDLHQATVLAAAVIASIGLDGSLVFQVDDNPERLLERLRSDARLQRRVDLILNECFERARQLLIEQRATLHEMARLLSVNASLDASEIAHVVGH